MLRLVVSASLRSFARVSLGQIFARGIASLLMVPAGDRQVPCRGVSATFHLHVQPAGLLVFSQPRQVSPSHEFYFAFFKELTSNAEHLFIGLTAIVLSLWYV